MKLYSTLALATALFVACDGSGADPANAPSDGGAGDACSIHGVVPPNLRDVERDAEGVSYSVFGEYPTRAADWPRATQVLGLLRDVWKSTRKDCSHLPTAARNKVDAAITVLEDAISTEDQELASRAANDVHLQMGPLFAYFKPITPLEVVRMDATFLRAGIDAHFGNWSAYEADLTSLENDWNTLRDAASEKVPTCHRVAGTASVVGDTDDTLMRMRKGASSMDVAKIETESDAGLIEVDIMELLFDCPPDKDSPSSGLGSACASDDDCRAEQTCDLDNRGGRCAPDRASTNVGVACSTTLDCGNYSRDACNNEAGDGFPGGYCTLEPCDDIQVCPPGATCVALPFETPACMQSCQEDGDCRTQDGYVCQLFPTMPPNGFGPSDHACAFACEKDEGCTSPLKCETSSGTCTP